MVKEDLKVFDDFFHREFLDKGSNATYSSLIPKKEGVEELGDFWPINFLGSTYKIISKCVASRFKLVLPSVVSQVQGAFLKGRSISDGALCANECIDSRIYVSISGYAKWIWEKTNDHVSWSFLIDVLRRFGFGVKWRNWIKKFVSLASFSILLNGVPVGYFGCS